MFTAFFRTHNRPSTQASPDIIPPLSTCGGMSGKSSMSAKTGCHVLRYQVSPNLSVSYHTMIYGMFLMYVQQGLGWGAGSCLLQLQVPGQWNAIWNTDNDLDIERKHYQVLHKQSEVGPRSNICHDHSCLLAAGFHPDTRTSRNAVLPWA